MRCYMAGARRAGFGHHKVKAQTTDRVIRKLIAGGHLRTETVINPINRCPTRHRHR
ncbi:hypothetical protein IVB33_22875 [Bradyrhizobium sp. 24]|uniref:hypothetical protein n=1 Tax=unclassified Bradyrhizobium TaxID=2631580 RepID=UPI001FFA65F3|nr:MULTISPECIES: hypothetical protein [unclassified Bradyrhizobium]MCK1296764.1 hypothetical protein [Bradyrhizobium sp. 37]MCK1380135.1 hypothetical protein [Bradyrhizobium sp. 24]MCK1769000.1 hypothetical protein [Bradyrhizobium sp. 134]